MVEIWRDRALIWTFIRPSMLLLFSRNRKPPCILFLEHPRLIWTHGFSTCGVGFFLGSTIYSLATQMRADHAYTAGILLVLLVFWYWSLKTVKAYRNYVRKISGEHVIFNNPEFVWWTTLSNWVGSGRDICVALGLPQKSTSKFWESSLSSGFENLELFKVITDRSSLRIVLS